MSQTVRFTEVNGAFYPEVFTAFPDRDEAVSMAQEMVEDGAILPSDDYYEVATEWFEVGEGESGMHTFFDDETIIEWHNKGDFVKRVTDAGYNVEYIGTQTLYVPAEEVNGEEDEEE